ncbi:MAG: hypothetical protein JRH12_20300 [Deltaproteobacteria bacterium]|jgi:hypothetical protein|nr:hypothetical protein [Deltaproteobacteria bacterium]MBW2478757.1 hypothetical protein [Deltaproteobacteria bacterium]
MQTITDPLPINNCRALISGENSYKIDLLKRHLAEYFSKIDLLSDSGQLNLLTADSYSVIVVTDTAADVLNRDFLTNLRSLHPRARLLCLVDRVTQDTEKALRSAGLLFLGSYDHFGACYRSILQTVLWSQKTNKHQPSQTSNKTPKAFRSTWLQDRK